MESVIPNSVTPCLLILNPSGTSSIHTGAATLCVSGNFHQVCPTTPVCYSLFLSGPNLSSLSPTPMRDEAQVVLDTPASPSGFSMIPPCFVFVCRISMWHVFYLRVHDTTICGPPQNCARASNGVSRRFFFFFPPRRSDSVSSACHIVSVIPVA